MGKVVGERGWGKKDCEKNCSNKVRIEVTVEERRPKES
jgi:hypothetical protein